MSDYLGCYYFTIRIIQAAIAPQDAYKVFIQETGLSADLSEIHLTPPHFAVRIMFLLRLTWYIV